MVPRPAVRAVSRGTFPALPKAADAVPRGVLSTAYPAELTHTLALSLVVSKRLTPVAAWGLGDKSAAGEPSPAAEIQGGRERSPQRHQDLPRRESSVVSSADVAPLRRSNSGVLQHRVQGQGGGVSHKDTLRGTHMWVKYDVSRLAGSNLLQHGGGLPVSGA